MKRHINEKKMSGRKTITIKKETWQNLAIIKIQKGYKDYSELLDQLISNFNK